MNSYSYKVKQLITQDIDQQPRRVVKILYTVTADNGLGQTCSLADSVNLPLDTVDSQFVSFDQLTEPVVLQWLNSKLTQDLVSEHQQRLSLDMDALVVLAQLNTTLVTQLPWISLDGSAPVPDQKLAQVIDRSLTPFTDSTPPGCYLLNSDGSLKILESIVDPTVE